MAVFFCPKCVLGPGTLCSDGYPGKNSEMMEPFEQRFEQRRCRAWQIDCDSDRIGYTGYCKLIDMQILQDDVQMVQEVP